MYTLMQWNQATGQIHKIKEIDFEAIKADKVNYYWLDFCGHDEVEEKELLASKFAINKLAISDALRFRHPPKYESFSNTDFILLKSFVDNEDHNSIETRQLAIFVVGNLLITRHKLPLVILDDLRDELQHSEFHAGPIYLALNIAKRCAGTYTNKLLQIEERLEDLEEEMFLHPNDVLLTELVSHKTYLRRLKRILAYHKTVFNDMEYKFKQQQDKNVLHPINDAYEHFERGYSLSALYYDMSSDLIDGYLSVASHRLNEIMKILTIITAIFVPLSFIAGLYGMNFENMPELKYKYGYFFILFLMFSLAGFLLYIFRKNKWL